MPAPLRFRPEPTLHPWTEDGRNLGTDHTVSPLDPPLDIETFEPIEPPWQAIREWIPDGDADPSGDLFDQTPVRSMPVEIRRQDGSILVLD
ncbi:MAG: hypothetical protein RLZZ244_28 [Verrucomicrobiota bacterium]